MTCAEARALFSALVDDEVTAAERAAADTHLAGCTECRHELDRFSRAVSMVRALPAERAPAGLVDRVVEAVPPVPWPRRLARRPFVPVRAKVPMQVAAMLLVATTAVWVFQRTPELQQARNEAPATPAPAPPSPGASSSRARTPAPPTMTANEAARQTAPALKDDAGARAVETQARAKEEKAASTDTIAPREIAPREMETRAEGDVGGLAAGSKAAETPAPAPAPAPAREAMAKQSAPSLTARAAAADVSGSWRVEDRATALRELEGLVTRVGGGPVTRRAEGGVEIVEFSVPREAYGDVTNVLEWFGRLTVVPATGELPPTVRVSLRVTG